MMIMNILKRNFSVSAIANKSSLIAERFPITVVFVVGVACLFFIMINDGSKLSYKFWIFCSAGVFVSLAASLCAEDLFNAFKTQCITLIAALLWGVYCFFLPAESKDVSLSKGIEIGVLCAVSVFLVFFISFLKKDMDKAFWNFTTKTLFQLALAGVFGMIFWSGLSLAILAIQQLFDVKIDHKIYTNLATVCYVLFSPIYFLANIPYKTEKHDDEIQPNNVLKILALYILTPILATYAVILYAYLFKIIVAWELPNGWVSWLVSALGSGGLIVIALLFPLRLREENRFVVLLSRYMGLFILPLLVLMSIGIFRRIGDYGITINRCYILLLNLWFYGIYTYIFITKSKHIKWILISPIIVALLSSVGFWCMANVTQKVRTAEISAYFNDRQMTIEEAKSMFSEMAEKERERIKSNFEYLHKTYGEESVQPFFSQDIQEFSRNTAYFDTENINEAKFFSERDIDKLKIVAFKTGYPIVIITKVIMGILIRERYIKENGIDVDDLS